MTKSMIAMAASAAALLLAGPAFAGNTGPMPAPMGQGADPCLLGTAQPGECVGPVRIAREVTVGSAGQGVGAGMAPSGPVMMAHHAPRPAPRPAPQAGWTPAPTYAAPVYAAPVYAAPAPAPVYAEPAPAYAAPVYAAPPGPPLPGQGTYGVAPAGMAGCSPQMIAQRVPCNGQWVYATAPQPVPVAPPMVYQPPVAPMAPAPQGVGQIPLTFFAGGINNGVGFNTETVYTYGGGGIVIGGGGPRFSGVRERSPTPLIPPRRNPPRHAPPPQHCGHC